MEKKILVKITNNTGHSSLMLSPQEALDVARTETKEHGKWCYVDGKFCKVENINISDLEKCESVVLVNQLQGG